MKTSNEIELRKLINRNFLIRVTFINKKPITFDELVDPNKPEIKVKNEVRLVGGGQYHKYVGKELAEKHFKKVLSGGLDKYTFKLRSKRRIDFVAK